MHRQIAFIIKLRIFGLICGLFILETGCVSIYDNVNVQKPETVDQYQRNILDKCLPHTLPHRVILAQMPSVNPPVLGGGPDVNDQQGFDDLWNKIQPVQDLSGDVTSFGLKPLVSWGVQTAHFLPILTGNSCEKIKPLAMETDCYTINIVLYKYTEGKNCSDPTSFPVLIYIYPKTPLPMAIKWWDKPDYNPTPQPEKGPTK
jgi:hypothetical protein